MPATYDHLYQKKTGKEWADLLGARVLDPDGWRHRDDGVSYHETPITKHDFDNRLVRCTIDSTGYPEFMLPPAERGK